MIELARPAESVRYRLTVDDFHAMAEAGILKREQRVELIEGDVIQMSPIGSEHSAVVGRLNKRLVLSVGDRAVVWIQCSVRLSRHSEPQPDALILRPREDDYGQSLPTPDDVIVLVEVADTSLSYDRSTKLPLYARHGIEEVWLVNLRARQVEVFRGPEADGFAEKHTVGREGILQPAAMPDLDIPVADLLR